MYLWIGLGPDAGNRDLSQTPVVRAESCHLCMLNAFHNRQEEILRFLRFATVGGLGTITDVGVLNLCHRTFGLSLLLANTISFLAAVIQNFLLHRRWTFPPQTGLDTRIQLLKYTGTSLIGLGISQLVFLGVYDLLQPFWELWLGTTPMTRTVSINFAKVVSIGIVLLWNYTSSRIWTFRV